MPREPHDDRSDLEEDEPREFSREEIYGRDDYEMGRSLYGDPREEDQRDLTGRVGTAGYRRPSRRRQGQTGEGYQRGMGDLPAERRHLPEEARHRRDRFETDEARDLMREFDALRAQRENRGRGEPDHYAGPGRPPGDGRAERDRGGPHADHRGRGPKNYRRSSQRIYEDVNDRLTEDAWIDAHEIEVEVEAGEVTLHGYVASRREKRRAEDISDSVSGVRHTQNNLRVTGSGDRHLSLGPAPVD